MPTNSDPFRAPGASADSAGACRAHADQQLQAIADSTLRTFISVDAGGARLQADLCDQVAANGGSLGPLHGQTVGVKDLIDVAGLRTTMGSQQYQSRIATEDAAVVTSLRVAGAVILGKTNTHEFAYGPTGDVSWSGPVRNPHDPDRISGGSSSGSAAAVAAGLCDLALGTDTSASVRVPAALCGVVGLKPGYDLLSRHGVFTLSQSLDHVGTLSRDVAGSARLLEVLTGRAGAYSATLERGVKGLRVGMLQRFYGEFITDPVRRSHARALQALRDSGAEIVEIDLPEIQDIFNAQQVVLRAEAYANHQSALRQELPFSDEVRARLLTGKDISAAEYLDAKGSQAAARAAFDRVLGLVDVLLTPTTGTVAPSLQERLTELDGQMHPTFWLLIRLTAPTNFTGHPSLSVPFGSSAGLPIGLQLIGRFGDEALLLRAGRALEHAAQHADTAPQ
ncbi:MAG: amidase [Comamonas sp.]